MKELVIVPAYNEELNLPDVISDLRENCPNCDIVVINDCSLDGTSNVARSSGVPVLDLSVNLGIGGAVQTGYRYADANGYDVAIQFDGDGQHDARYIPHLLKPIEENQADMVIGSRFIERNGFQSTGLRRAGINFLSRVIHLCCGEDIKDVTSGMRAINRKTIRFFVDHYAQDFPEPESVLTAAMAGARIVEIPVEMRERRHGTSSIGSFGSAYYMIKVTLTLFISRMFIRKRDRI